MNRGSRADVLTAVVCRIKQAVTLGQALEELFLESKGCSITRELLWDGRLGSVVVPLPPLPTHPSLTTERVGGFVPRYHSDPSVDGIQSEENSNSHGSKWPNAAQTCSLPSSPPPHPPIHPSLTTERAGGLVPRHHPDSSVDSVQSEESANSHGSRWPNSAQTCPLPLTSSSLSLSK